MQEVAPPAVAANEREQPFHQVPLEVTETAGVDRILWPVTAGIPLPAGVLQSPRDVALLHGATPVPVQAEVLSRWPDGSARWLLLDFQLTLRAYQQVPLTVQIGRPSILPPQAVTVRESQTGLEISTGEISFSVPRNRFAPLANLALRRGPAAGPLALSFSSGGTEYTAEPPRVARVALRGPLRAEVTLEGGFGTPIDYSLRIDAYAGKAFVRLYYTFINKRDQFYSRIDRIGARFAFPAESRGFGGDGDEVIIASLGGNDQIVQDNPDHFRAGHFQGRRAAGWVEARGERGSLLLASRFFWQEYPQSFAVSPSGVEYLMWAGEKPLLLGSGAAKTHEIAVMLRPAASPAEDAAATARALRTPPAARPVPEYTASTGALSNSLEPADPLHRHVLRSFSLAWSRYLRLLDQDPWADTGTLNCSVPGSKRFGYYGMLNWGDWNFPGYMDRSEGCDGWGNLEYDLPQVLALAFLSGGSPDYRSFLDASARHYMDVDIIHHSPARPHLVGMNHPHKALHFALDSHTSVDLGHTWNEGLVSYYWLAGDRRGLQAARGIADYLVWRGKTRKSGNPRQWGWPMIALVTAYRATADDRYLRSAKLYATRAMSTTPPAPANPGFKLGILADGLSYVHEVTADQETITWLRAYAANLAARPDGISDIRLVPGIAYVAVVDGDERLTRIAAESVRRAHPGGWGKSLAAVTRAMLRAASLLGRFSSASPEG